MTKMQFQAAAVRVQGEIDKEIKEGEQPAPEILEFGLAGQDFKLNMPTPTQIILLSTSADDGTMRAMIGASMAFLEGLMVLDDSYKRFRKLMSKGIIGYDLLLGGDDDNSQGIIDWIVAQVSDGRPTTSSSDSVPSPATTGQRSTGRVRGQASIHSDSP